MVTLVRQRFKSLTDEGAAHETACRWGKGHVEVPLAVANLGHSDRPTVALGETTNIVRHYPPSQ